MATLTSTTKAASPPETFWPDATGWNVTGFVPASISADATLAAADLNDSSLTLECMAQWASVSNPADADFQDIIGGTWQGGPGGRSGTAHQPHYGPYAGTVMPQGARRMRVRVRPSRATAPFAWTLTTT